MKVSESDLAPQLGTGHGKGTRPQRAMGNEASHKPSTSTVVRISSAAIQADLDDSGFSQLSDNFHRTDGGGASMQRGIGVYSRH